MSQARVSRRRFLETGLAMPVTGSSLPVEAAIESCIKFGKLAALILRTRHGRRVSALSRRLEFLLPQLFVADGAGAELGHCAAALEARS